MKNMAACVLVWIKILLYKISSIYDSKSTYK